MGSYTSQNKVYFFIFCNLNDMVVLMKIRFDILSIFKMFHKDIKNQFAYPIKTVQSDNTLELCNMLFKNIVRQLVLFTNLLCAPTPQRMVLLSARSVTWCCSNSNDSHACSKVFLGWCNLNCLLFDVSSFFCAEWQHHIVFFIKISHCLNYLRNCLHVFVLFMC